MNTSLDEFVSEIKKSGMANANRYFVEIAGASKLIGLFCENAQLPGTQILSTPARTFGEIREVPYELQYDPVNLSLYVDNNWMVKKFFDEWRLKVFNYRNRTSGYYKDYVRNVKIYCYNKDNQQTYGVELYEAFPKTIGAINLDYGNKEIPRLAVTLQYGWWAPLRVSGQPNTSSTANAESFVEAGKRGIFGGGGNAPAYAGGTEGGGSAWDSMEEFSQMDGLGIAGGLAGGFGDSQIDFGNILGSYFTQDPFQSMSASSFLTSFGGFQSTYNSFASNPKGAIGSLGKFLT